MDPEKSVEGAQKGTSQLKGLSLPEALPLTLW
jgi:hypothetical protein